MNEKKEEGRRRGGAIDSWRMPFEIFYPRESILILTGAQTTIATTSVGYDHPMRNPRLCKKDAHQSYKKDDGDSRRPDSSASSDDTATEGEGSDDSTSIVSLQGLVNFGLLAFLVLSAKFFIVTQNKNGYIPPWFVQLVSHTVQWPCVTVYLLSFLFPHISFICELVASATRYPVNVIASGLGWVNAGLSFLVPVIFYAFEDSTAFPFAAALSLITAAIVMMKLHSYHHVNLTLRLARNRRIHLRNLLAKSQHSLSRVQRFDSDFDFSSANNIIDNNLNNENNLNNNNNNNDYNDYNNISNNNFEDEKLKMSEGASIEYAKAKSELEHGQRGYLDPPEHILAKYPGNLTLANLYYFLVAPTLCYDFNYPRTRGIKWGRVLHCLFEFTICIMVSASIINELFFPESTELKRVMHSPTYEWTWISAIDFANSLLKISCYCLAVWFIVWYAVNHTYLNILGELTRFADRLFYGDWWNSREMDYFWRTWCYPIHTWMIRHLLSLIRQFGVSVPVAHFCCFLFTAIVLETVVIASFRLLWLRISVTLLAQILVCKVFRSFEKYFSRFFANILFWLTKAFIITWLFITYHHYYILVRNPDVAVTPQSLNGSDPSMPQPPPTTGRVLTGVPF